MRTHAHSEDGFLMIELVAAVLIISVALLALIGAYSLGYFAINSSGQTTSAGLLANNQLELYAAIPYASIGLDATTLASVKSTDAYYSTDETALPGSGSDATISSCGSSAQCSPVQTITGGDHKTYKVETFIRMIANPNVSGSSPDGEDHHRPRPQHERRGSEGRHDADGLRLRLAFVVAGETAARPSCVRCAREAVVGASRVARYWHEVPTPVTLLQRQSPTVPFGWVGVRDGAKTCRTRPKRRRRDVSRHLDPSHEAALEIAQPYLARRVWAKCAVPSG